MSEQTTENHEHVCDDSCKIKPIPDDQKTDFIARISKLFEKENLVSIVVGTVTTDDEFEYGAVGNKGAGLLLLKEMLEEYSGGKVIVLDVNFFDKNTKKSKDKTSG